MANSPPPNAPRRSTVRERLRQEGVWEVGRSYVADRYAGAVRRLAHRFVAPRMMESYARATLQSTDAAAILTRIPGFPRDRVGELVVEFREVSDGLKKRYGSSLPYPTVSAFSGAESLLVYGIVRGRAPQRVVETGVANGHSSYLILEALRRNGGGQLTSIDVRPDVGALIPPELRAGWDLRLLSRRRPRRDLEAVFASIPSIDLFIHDSDHTYRWQSLEFALAWSKLSAAGWLASDDVDWSYAFVDFAAATGRSPLVLVSESKAFGLLPKTG
ncbi:MAG: class I SAM-dependent methyltransferase [Thermoplasmata archaeon]|nr:class I SAM-dependent methyltransferase [Thermoplasmata archaeon]